MSRLSSAFTTREARQAMRASRGFEFQVSGFEFGFVIVFVIRVRPSTSTINEHETELNPKLEAGNPKLFQRIATAGDCDRREPRKESRCS
jgi:hypothetical protein